MHLWLIKNSFTPVRGLPCGSLFTFEVPVFAWSRLFSWSNEKFETMAICYRDGVYWSLLILLNVAFQESATCRRFRFLSIINKFICEYLFQLLYEEFTSCLSLYSNIVCLFLWLRISLNFFVNTNLKFKSTHSICIIQFNPNIFLSTISSYRRLLTYVNLILLSISLQYLLLEYISHHYNPNVIHLFELRDIFGTHFWNVFLEYFWKEIESLIVHSLSHRLNISCMLLRVTFTTSALLHLYVCVDTFKLFLTSLP